MGIIQDMISSLSHRPYPLPTGVWRYYQEWNDALFLHWQVPFEVLRQHVPATLRLDSFEGNCYISLVAFTMQNIRPIGLPAVKFISDFHEINMRTYVEHNGKKGVYFLNIEAEKHLSVFIAKNISGLPYRRSVMRRSAEKYSCVHPSDDFNFEAKFSIGEIIQDKTALDKWLTERYCLYLDQDENVFRYDIHHKEWELQQVELNQMKLKYDRTGFSLVDRTPLLTHYSKGVQVIAWRKQKI
jgi:uncharacterized protein YqjF (DUF2071 family)